ncbi:MAG TPA: RT0821/Lpp0805 family surface protein [Candidatus Cybelea sp.]|nr:RT0821/Lpp0805 family surface protein [Candidatus Cybelea sp.]
MKIAKFAGIAVIVAALAACQDTGPKEGAGTVIGGVGGALAGSAFGHGRGQLFGVAAGTLIGALVGSQIGKSLDQADQDHIRLANQRALESSPSGQPVTWNNPDNGNHGTVTPTRTYQTSNGQYCREFQQTIVVGGEQQQGFGTACRQPDGSWRIQG